MVRRNRKLLTMYTRRHIVARKEFMLAKDCADGHVVRLGCSFSSERVEGE